MDISAIRTNDITELIIQLPDGTETDIKMGVLSADSDEYKKHSHKVRNKNLESRNRNLTAERVEEQTLEIVSRSVKWWENVDDNGTPVECNFNNVKDLFIRFPWMKEQVDVAAGRRVNFLDVAPVN